MPFSWILAVAVRALRSLVKRTIALSFCVVVGNDIRKAVADGFPVEGVIGSDLHPGAYDTKSERQPWQSTEHLHRQSSGTLGTSFSDRRPRRFQSRLSPEMPSILRILQLSRLSTQLPTAQYRSSQR